MTINKRFAGLATSVVLASGIGAVALVQAAASDSRPDPDASRATSVDGAQAAAFRVLRRAQNSSDAVTGQVSGPFGANLDLARSVQTSAGRVWVVPARGEVCLRALDGVGAAWSCAPTSAAADGALMLSLRKPDSAAPVAVFGLVADNVDLVELASAGAEGPVSVVDNVFGAKVVRPKAVTLHRGGTATAFDVP
jgi:hypothetical protein